MDIKRYLLALLAVFLLPLAGSRQPATQSPRYVTEAEVIFCQPEGQTHLTYRQPSKISSVLTCLRLAAPHGQVKAADTNPDAHHYRITLSYSDTTRQVYHIQDYRYLSPDGIIWQKVRTNNAHMLYLLVHLLPGD